MKKIYFSLITLMGAMSMSAQILNQANNAPVVGEMYSTMHCDSTINPGPSGANVLWSYPNLSIYASVVSNYTTSAVVAPGYPGNGQVTASSPNDLSYTSSDATVLKYHGGNFKVQNVEASFTYSAPAIYAAYPTSLNTTSTSAVGGSINITQPQAATGDFTGTSKFVADGTGTLVLPGATGTFTNVLRTLSTQTLNYSVASGFVTGIVTIFKYNYFAAGVKVPILSITTETIVVAGSPSTASFAAVYKDYLNPPTNTATAISEKRNTPLEVLVFPNPSAYVINFTTENPNAKEVTIYDITGKLVEKLPLYSGKLKLDVSNYNNGIYIYNVLNAKGAILKTGKVAVDH